MKTIEHLARRALHASLLATVFMTGAQSASALSCLEPSATRSFVDAQVSEEIFRVYRGSFDAGVQKGRSRTASFAGHQLGLDGFKAPVEFEIELRSICSGAWCGSISDGQEILVFAREEGDRQVVEAGACGGWVFGPPDAETEAALAACIRGEECLVH